MARALSERVLGRYRQARVLALWPDAGRAPWRLESFTDTVCGRWEEQADWLEDLLGVSAPDEGRRKPGRQGVVAASRETPVTTVARRRASLPVSRSERDASAAVWSATDGGSTALRRPGTPSPLTRAAPGRRRVYSDLTSAPEGRHGPSGEDPGDPLARPIGPTTPDDDRPEALPARRRLDGWDVPPAAPTDRSPPGGWPAARSSAAEGPEVRSSRTARLKQALEEWEAKGF